MGYDKYRYRVLVTVSAAALMLTVERGPLAADISAPVAQDRWWASVEGQYLLFDGDSAKYRFDSDDDLGFRLKPDDGWGIGGEIGFQPGDSPWSFLGRVRYGQSNKDTDDGSLYTPTFAGFNSFSAKADHREEHILADLEIGRDVGLGALGEGSNIRLFAGVRFAHFKGKGSLHTNYYSNFYGNTFTENSDVDIRRTFTGIWPRVGFNAIMPLSDQFSLDVDAAGAVLFGKQKFKADGTHYSNFDDRYIDTSDIREHRSKNAVVPNLEASAAFSWLISDNAKFSLGYRVDSYWDVYDNGDIEGGRDDGDRIIHGPFVKLTIGGAGR